MYLDRVYNYFFEGRKDLTMLDLGANLGLFSFYAQQYAKKIYAFEPSEVTFKLLEANIKDLPINNITPYKMAVANEDGETTFYTNSNTTMNSMEKFVDDHNQSEKVKTIRLDTFLNQEKIDHINFAKIDVEGSEGKLICGDGFANIAPKIDALVYEFHSWSGYNPVQINNCLWDLGFKVFQIPCDALVFGAEKRK